MLKTHGQGTTINAADVYVLEGITAEAGSIVNIISTKKGLPEGTGLPAGNRSTIGKIWASAGSTINMSNSLITGERNDPSRRWNIGVWNNGDLGGNPSVGVWGGTIRLDHVDVIGVVEVASSGHLVMNGGSIREVTPADIAKNYKLKWTPGVALDVDTGGKEVDATLTDVDILGRVVIHAHDGNITINGGSIEVEDPVVGYAYERAVTISNGTNVLIDGTSIRVKNGDGIHSSGTDTVVKNFDLLTSATKPVVGIRNFGQFALENGRIRTEGDQVLGILAEQGVLTADNLSIETSGEQAHGVTILDGMAELNDVDVAVASADGLHLAGNAGRKRPGLAMNGGSITVSGSKGHGVLSDTRIANARAELNGVNIAIGADSYALGFVGSERSDQGSWISLDTSNAVAVPSYLCKSIQTDINLPKWIYC